MQTIYKYPLPPIATRKIAMPFGAKILCLQMQNDTPCIWALVEKTNTPHNYIFHTYETGEEIPFERTDDVYIGTYQLKGEHSVSVFHVFKEPK